MANIPYKAIQDGNWNDPNTWAAPAPGLTIPLGSVVTIPPNITVTIPAGVTVAITNGHMYLSGGLTVAGTLALTINGPRDPQRQDFFDTLIDAPGTLTVASGGQMTIVSQGYVSSGTPIPVHAINVSGGLTNQGSIVMTCSMYCPSPGSFGRGYGISLHDGTLDNSSSITITSTSVQHDGDGPPYAINCYSGTVRNRSGCNITSTPPAGGIPAGGTIRILQGTFTNEGNFLNYGEFANNGAGSNSGSITQVYPAAAYSGSGTVTGDGSVQLQGTLKTALSLDQAMPGQSNFSVPSGQPLTVNAPFTVPATYTLDCRANILGTATFTNNGTLKWDLSGARYSGDRDILGNGNLILRGTLSSAGEFDLNKISRNISIPSAVTVAAGALLLLPRNATLTIASGGSLTTQAASGSTPPGIFWFGGTVQNNGSLVNNGILKYWLPSGTLAGPAAAFTGSGQIALMGDLNAGLSLASLPGTNCLIMAADTLNLSGNSLTVSSNKTLTVQGGSSPGTLTHGGATIFIEGALVNNGTIGSTSVGTIVHCFPNASYSGTAPGMIAEIRLKGAAGADVTLGTLGYGTGIPFRISSEAGYALTVNGTLTVSQNTTLLCAGNLTAGTIQNNGTFVYNFQQSSITRTTYSGSGTVCLNGLIKETQTYAQVTAPFFGGPQIYQVRAGDQLIFLWDTDLPAGHRLRVFGDFSVTFATLTLNTPLSNGQNISATVEVMAGASFSNDGTIALRNTQYVGLWFRNMSLGTHPSYPINSGMIDASVDQPSFCFNANCAVLVENTMLDNSNGTIQSGPTGRPTIYCNSGLICGGTLSGQVPTGAGMPPNTQTTYSTSCS